MNYRFRIQPIGMGSARRFQLRVGMEGERDFEYIPVHCSAFAGRVALEVAHDTPADAHVELSGLLHWLDDRRGGFPAVAAVS